MNVEDMLKEGKQAIDSIIIDEKDLRKSLNAVLNTAGLSKNKTASSSKNYKYSYKVCAAIVCVFILLAGGLRIISGGFSQSKLSDEFVMNGRNYYFQYTYVESDEVDLNNIVGTIKKTTTKMLFKSNLYQLKNGDAVLLDKGTKIYVLKAFNPDYRVAVLKDGKALVYQAFDNLKPGKGKDMLKIDGQVKYIAISKAADEDKESKELVRIEDKNTINMLVNEIMTADIASHNGHHNDYLYNLSFFLEDGSKFSLAYNAELNQMCDFYTGQDFSSELEEIISKSSAK